MTEHIFFILLQFLEKKVVKRSKGQKKFELFGFTT
jgi:hypothetical protein